MRTKWWALGLAPALGYPVFAAVLFARDVLAGDRLLLHDVRFDRRWLWDTFWSDWLHALPTFYLLAAAGAAVWLLLRAAGRARRARSLAAFMILAVAAGLAAPSLFRNRPLASTPLALPPRPHVWLIGGGPDPDHSQVQIEFETRRVLASLPTLIPGAAVRVFYGPGTGAEAGAVETRAVPASDPLEPLARVFGQDAVNATAYRAHRVPGVLGTTRRDALLPVLARQLDSLRPGDRALIVYEGHGSVDHDRADNALRLWGDTRLTVRDLAGLLAHVDTAVPVRFVLPQCFGGAFERAVHPGAADERTLVPGARCGFMAQSADVESEGCRPALDSGDYRDYTTYFLNALTGRTQLGVPIAGSADRDGDGRVSPFEAHLYVIANSVSVDVPRATSEVYLERWQPWSTRWSEPRLPGNVYGVIARELARRNDLPEDGAALGAALGRREREVAGRMGTLAADRAAVEETLAQLQRRVQGDLAERWPAANHPYTAAFRDVLDRHLAEADSFVVRHPAYAELSAGVARLAAIDTQEIGLRRQAAQLAKLRRTRLLARALAQFERLASAKDREAYGRLRRCEELPL